jgi:hypothetical protein
LWDSTLGGEVQVVVVTRGPEHEEPRAVPAATDGVVLIMSTRAWSDYQVFGPPFFALVDGRTARVATEGVAWGLEPTAETVRRVLGGQAAEPDMVRLTPPDDGLP